MPSQSDWVISLSRAHALVSCGYTYITISVSLLVSRAAPPASTAERNKNSWENIPIFIGTDREEKHFFFSWVLVFFLCHRTEQTTRKRKKERSNRWQREREREKKRHEKELERTRESFNQKHMNHKSTTFCREKKLCLSTHQMASPEAAAILRELQGKNGNGVRF